MIALSCRRGAAGAQARDNPKPFGPYFLGAGGVEKIVELSLSETEQEEFKNSVDAVKSLVTTMAELLS